MELIDKIFLILIIGVPIILNIYKMYIKNKYKGDLQKTRNVSSDSFTLHVIFSISLLNFLYIIIRPIYYLINKSENKSFSIIPIIISILVCSLFFWILYNFSQLR